MIESEPDIAYYPVESNGLFPILFNKGLAGPAMIKSLGKAVSSQGIVLNEFVDDIDLLANTKDRQRRNLVSVEE